MAGLESLNRPGVWFSKEEGYVFSFEEVDQVIEELAVTTKSHYIVYKKEAAFDVKDAKFENKQVFWESPKGASHHVEYDGIPFIPSGNKVYWCHQGKDKHKCDKLKNRNDANTTKIGDHQYGRAVKRRFRVQNTKKKNCPAVISVKHVFKFPNYKITRNSEWLRKQSAKDLKSSFADGTVKYESRFYIKLPNPNDHVRHILGEAAGISEPLDEAIKDKITELVGMSVRKVSDIKRYLEHYVKNDLFRGKAVPPKTRRRYYPRRKDIANHISKIKRAKRFTQIDQDYIGELVRKWKVERPNDSFFFRPHSLQEDSDDESDDDSDCEVDDVEDIKAKRTSINLKNKFLFCYQSEQQARLLVRYGNSMCLLDATYRTTRYALPLFFLCVPTNVGYQVVGLFVVQYEDIESIQEALGMFKQWNSRWKPKNFMVDFADEEIQALEAVFPESKVFLCDFHREKAWSEWVSKIDNGVSTHRDEVLKYLRSIAHATTQEKFDASVKALKESHVWKTSAKLQKWQEGKWLPNAKRWVQAFRVMDMEIAVHTNNGVERQNEALKYEYLVGYRNCSLSEMLSVVIDNFVPDSYLKYISLNVQYSDAYRMYNEELPKFLWNKPRHVVDHVMKRWKDCWYAKENICMVQPGKFTVQSSTSSSQWYEVNFGNDTTQPSCQCLDWYKTKLPCKHFCAIFNNTNYQWDDLSCLYLSLPILSLDDNCICQSRPESGDTEPNNLHVQPPITTSTIIPPDDVQVTGVDRSNKPLATNNESLPLRRKTKKTLLQAKCRVVLKKINGLTYLVKDIKNLRKLEDQLQLLFKETEAMVTSDKGVILEASTIAPTKTKTKKKPKKRKASAQDCKSNIHTSTTKKPRRMKLKKSQDLPERKYGKPKHPYSKRVGVHADMMKKHYKVNVPVPSSEKNLPCPPVFPPTIKKPQQNKATFTKTTQIMINLTQDQLQAQQQQTNEMWIPSLGLTRKNESTLRSQAWLTDGHINSCQHLMQKQFPHIGGFVNSLLVSHQKMKSPLSSTSCIQIHHSNSHWVMSHLSNGEITVYDSMSPVLTTQLGKQLVYLYKHNTASQGQMRVRVTCCQKQIGSNDCGLFAIANALALAEGFSLRNIMFNQSEMRGHLYNCLCKQRLTMFPHKSVENGSVLSMVFRIF